MTLAADTATAASFDPVALLQELIRFPTVNPPGGEGPFVRHVAELLRRAGLDIRLVGIDPERPNLVATLAGEGMAPPLLLHAHADVVPVDGQEWSQPPFGGVIADGHVWGRGSIDMKGTLAMMLSAISRICAAGARPPGDIVLALSPDEETGSAVGAHYLVTEHPAMFAGIQHAIGEDGGAVFNCGDRRSYPIVVAEKRACWLRVTLRGPGGHGSRQGPPDSAMSKLARMLSALQRRLPMHLTPAIQLMLTEVAAVSEQPVADRLLAIAQGSSDEVPYDLLPAADAAYLDSVLRHTVNATIVRTSDKINSKPSLITVDLDGRILPGRWTVPDFLAELRGLIGPEPEVAVLLEGEPMPEPVLGSCYDLIVSVLREADPEGIPLPMLTPASTDARLFASLGIACYGWLPLLAPPGARYQETMHAGDERIPLDGLRFGADCMYQLLRRYR
jgi:acetylornithine deacetylase/succinyl-diaminopimelate desuccinylase-like protein